MAIVRGVAFILGSKILNSKELLKFSQCKFRSILLEGTSFSSYLSKVSFQASSLGDFHYPFHRRRGLSLKPIQDL